MQNSHEAVVNSFYLAYYGRPADPAGLAYWSAHLERANGDPGAIAQAFATSEETTVRFGTSDAAARITQIYETLFERAPDGAGLAFWTDAIAQGDITLADAAIAILRGARQEDAALAALRQQAAADFTAEVAVSNVAYVGDAAIEAARVLVKAVGPQATPADIEAMVEAAARLVDIAHGKPEVIAAIATGTTLVALFDTARGMAEPVNLVKALADVAQAAAGNPTTLEALLRGGGMAKVLEVMPTAATLHDVVEALATGGLPAAVEVVYPTAPDDSPEPVLAFAFFGVQQGSGDTVVDNVTSVAQARVEFSYSGRTIGRGEHVEYSVDGTDWTTAGLELLKVGRTSVVSIATVDLSQGLPADVRARGIDSHADLGTTVYVRAVDASGKVLASASQAIVLDRYAAAPELTIEEDAAGAHFGVHLHHVRSTDAIGVGPIEAGARLEYQAAAGASSRGAEPIWSTVAPVFAEGENTIVVRQVDAAGNASEAASLTFTLDREAPGVPEISLQDDTGADAVDGITSNASVLIGGLDTLATTGWEYSTDGKNWTFGGVNDGSGTAVFDASVLGERSVSLQVRQIDAAGNTSAGDTLALTFDETAPTEVLAFVRIEGEPDGVATTAQAAAGITFAVTGRQDGIVEWRLKGDTAWTALAQADYNSDGTVTLGDVDLAQADPTIELRVVDAAGNPGATLSQAIDGPYVKPVIALTPAHDGLQVASPVAGTVLVGAAVALSDDAGHGAVAGTVTLGEQQQRMQGIVAVAPQAGPTITDGSLDAYGLGTAGTDVMEGRYLWGFGGADELTGTAGDDFLSGGAGADTLRAGAGRDTLDGGAGADEIHLGPDGVADTLVYRAGDTLDSVFANGGSATAMDRIRWAEQGDVFRLGSVFTAAPTVGDTFLTSAAVNQVAVVRGTLASGVFTANTTGTSYVLQWSDGSHVNSVLLQEYGDRPPGLDIDIAAGTVALDAPPPVGSALASVGLDLLGSASTITFNATGTQVTGLDNAATFVLSDYGTGSAQPTQVDYTAAPGFGIDGATVTLGEPLRAGLYGLSWQNDTFTTETGFLNAGSLYFAGGSDGLFHFEGFKVRDYLFKVTSGGFFGASDSAAFIVAATSISTPLVNTSGGHDLVVKPSREMVIEISDPVQDQDSDLVIGFDAGVDRVQFNHMSAFMVDQDFDGQIRWSAPASSGVVAIGATDEGASATVTGTITFGGPDNASAVTELNKVFDISQVARDGHVLLLVDDGGIGHGGALFSFTNRDGDAVIDADEVTALMMFADGTPQHADIVVVGFS